MSRTFSARRIAALEDRVRTFATELIDAFPEKGTVDFHNDFAVSFPVRVIHYALNMAPDVEGKVKNWSDAATAAIGNKLSHVNGLMLSQCSWKTRIIGTQNMRKD